MQNLATLNLTDTQIAAIDAALASLETALAGLIALSPTAKKRAMFMSLACTILGVGLFIVTQATTSGFDPAR